LGVLAVTQVFANVSTVIIPTGPMGPASPYPSKISVSGVASPVSKVTVTLPALWHTYPADLGMLVVGPGGEVAKLMDGCGDGFPLAGVSLTFEDTAASFLPGTNAITPGSYLPTSLYEVPGFYPNPAPQTSYGTNMNILATTPNGDWSLYVYDFVNDEGGALTNGWKISLITSNSTPVCCSSFPQPTLTSTTYSNNFVLFNWNSLPGPHYQVQYSTNLATSPWQNLGSSILGTNASMGIIDSVSNSPMRFYRVLVGP